MDTRGAPRKHRGLFLRIANVFIVLLVIAVLVLGVWEAYASWADPKSSAVIYAVNWLSTNTSVFPVLTASPTPTIE